MKVFFCFFKFETQSSTDTSDTSRSVTAQSQYPAVQTPTFFIPPSPYCRTTATLGTTLRTIPLAFRPEDKTGIETHPTSVPARESLAGQPLLAAAALGHQYRTSSTTTTLPRVSSRCGEYGISRFLRQMMKGRGCFESLPLFLDGHRTLRVPAVNAGGLLISPMCQLFCRAPQASTAIADHGGRQRSGGAALPVAPRQRTARQEGNPPSPRPYPLLHLSLTVARRAVALEHLPSGSPKRLRAIRAPINRRSDLRPRFGPVGKSVAARPAPISLPPAQPLPDSPTLAAAARAPAGIEEATAGPAR